MQNVGAEHHMAVGPAPDLILALVIPFQREFASASDQYRMQIREPTIPNTGIDSLGKVVGESSFGKCRYWPNVSRGIHSDNATRPELLRKRATRQHTPTVGRSGDVATGTLGRPRRSSLWLNIAALKE